MIRDSKWSAVSALAGLAAIVVTLLLFFLGRDSKELSVETVSHAILVDLTEPSLSSLKLTYKDISVSRLSVATIEIRNSGTRSIERADFERPILLRFKNPSDVLAVTLSERIPQELAPVISSDAGGTAVAPLLLNPGDRFRLTAQLRGDFNEPAVEARISGVPSISRRTFRQSSPIRRGSTAVGAGVIFTVAYFYFAVFALPHRTRPFVLLPKPEGLALVLLLNLGGAGLLVLGERLLDLSTGQGLALLGAAMFPGVVVSYFAFDRRSRLWSTLRTQSGATETSSRP